MTKYFQIPSQKYTNQAFLDPNLGIFVFSRNFAIRQIRGADFIYENMVFKFQPEIPKQGIFGAKFRHFRGFLGNFFSRFLFLHQTLQQDKFEDAVHISNMTKVFLNSTPKIRKLGIFGSSFKDFYFAPNVAIRQIRGR